MSYMVSGKPQKAIPQVQRSVAFGSVTSSFTRIGALYGTGLAWLSCYHTFNAPIEISLDGVNVFYTLPANSPLTIDFMSDNIYLDGSYGFYIRGTVTSGNCYCATIGSK